MRIEKKYHKRPVLMVLKAELLILILDLIISKSEFTTILFGAAFGCLNFYITIIFYGDILEKYNKYGITNLHENKFVFDGRIFASLCFIFFFSWSMSFYIKEIDSIELALLSAVLFLLIHLIFKLFYKRNMEGIDREVEYALIILFHWVIAIFAPLIYIKTIVMH